MYFIIIKKQTIQIVIKWICICDILVRYFYIDIDYMEMYGVLFGWNYSIYDKPQNLWI